jgi:hypothetical protein
MTDAEFSHRRSHDLPPYWAVLVIDAEGFSKTRSPHQAYLNAELQDALQAAFVRAGLTEAWEGRRFGAHTGDGYIVVTPAATLPHLLYPLLRELQAELEERDYRRLAHQPRLRLRASVHVGPLPDRGQPGEGVGAPMTETHRLLDSDEVREVLATTDESVTFLAAIVSQRAYLDAVDGGYTALLPTELWPVTARSKRFEERAYLHVPRPSGRLLTPSAPPAPEARSESARAAGAASRTAHIHADQVRDVILGDVGGPRPDSDG